MRGLAASSRQRLGGSFGFDLNGERVSVLWMEDSWRPKLGPAFLAIPKHAMRDGRMGPFP